MSSSRRERIYAWIALFLETAPIEIFNLVIFFIVWHVSDSLLRLNDSALNDLCNKTMECHWIMASLRSGPLQ